MDKIPAYFKDKEPLTVSINRQILLLANYSISHLLFLTWTLRTTSSINNIASVTLQSFAINHMPMLSQAI